MTTAVEAARAQFVSIVGASRVVSDEAACAASCAVDGMAPRHVVYAPSAGQAAAALRCAAEHRLAVIPCRNLTKLGIGNPPRRYDVALSLREMNRVLDYEPEDLTVTVEAGMKFGDLQHFVARHGLWLPLDPVGGARASVGGILATNSAGPMRLLYGSARDMVLGMKIATTEGKLISTGGRVVKNVAGYDLAKLLIGSYGTLGVIVEASLKLFPQPTQRASFVLQPGTLGIARDLHRRILDSPLQPMRMVLVDAPAARLFRPGSQAPAEVEELELWLETGGSSKVIERYARVLEALGRAAGVKVCTIEPEDSALAWARISDIAAWFAPAYAHLVILKAGLPIAGIEQFMSRAQQEAESEKVGLAAFGQLGVGVVRACLLEDSHKPTTVGLVERLRAAARELGGALVVERLASDLKAQVDVWGPPGDDFEVMRRLKSTWDPAGVLAPGRFVGGI